MNTRRTRKKQRSHRRRLAFATVQRFSVTLVLLFLGGNASIADVDGGYRKSIVENQSRIITERDCFAGHFDDYDSWIDKLDGMNSDLGRDVYESRFPRQEYNVYRQSLECRFFLYNVGRLTVEGFYVKPRGAIDTPLPVVVYNRGGNGKHSKMNFGGLFSKVFPLAESGFVIIGSQYRGGGIPPGQGDNGKDEFGGDDVNDVIALFDIVDSWDFVDAKRIGMLGWSRGAIMSFLVAAQTDRLEAVAVGGAPTDLIQELSVRPEMERVFQARIPDYDKCPECTLQARSVVYWLDELKEELPILLLHGQSDKKVTATGALRFAGELQQSGHPYRLVIFESGSHALLEHRQSVSRELERWFSKHLNAVDGG